MISEKIKKEYYSALIEKNSAYEGVFYVGVKTTGIFCRPTCSARKPKIENCEFYTTAEEALFASFRPCKVCKPLSNPNEVSEVIQILVEAVEKDPSKRWTNSDFEELSIGSVTARRQFQKRFGMTFVEYARARRMGIAMKQIREGESVINAQLSTGYQSSSGFRDAFANIMGDAPSKSTTVILKSHWIDTKLGPMLAVGDEDGLYILEFVDRRGLEKEIESLRRRLKAAIVPGINEPIKSIERELNLYFKGELKEFKTPVKFLGSEFQKSAWSELLKIPYGKTRSYSEQAVAIKNPKSFRAVANANGMNTLAIIIPCHRIINSSGDLGGYGGGIVRKKWLLDHENRNAK
jgi:AraC family transcriptional regulator of adaptative response/methylated-DNA-[protein]-cysteine methyltransferase